VKTGYVADADGIQALGPDGKLHFEWHQGQVMVNHHLKVVTEAAKRHITVDAHEPVKDTGLRRTYPNWVSREGERGMEYNAWGVPKNPPEHEANLIFTRMLSGPMDFTPGVVSLKGKGDTPILSTLAKQLALYITIYSPIQMAADLPENYEANPKAFQFIKDVAVDWDDTRVLAGEVGDYAVIARKARGSPVWFIGAVGDEQERRIDVALSFLDPKRHYRAEIYRDGDDADYRTNPRSMVVEQRTVTSTDRLALRLAPGGGAAVRPNAGDGQLVGGDPGHGQSGEPQHDGRSEHRPDGLVRKESLHDRTHHRRHQQLRHDDEDVEEAHVNAELALRQIAGEDRIRHRKDRRPGNADADLGNDQRLCVVNEQEARIACGSGEQTDRVGARLADRPCKHWEKSKRGHRGDAVVDGKQHPDPVASILVSRARWVRRHVEIACDDRRRVDPHDEERRPAE